MRAWGGAASLFCDRRLSRERGKPYNHRVAEDAFRKFERLQQARKT